MAELDPAGPGPRPDAAVHSTFVISLTAFAADGSLDEQAMRDHLRRMAAAGIGVYLGGSGSGEGYTLDPDELGRLLAIGVEELGGRVPVRAMGFEPRSAGEMVATARLGAAAGVDAVQVYPLDMGHGNLPRPAELRTYYEDVLGVLDLPLVLSTHQAVGYLLPVELVGEVLDRFPAVVGVNCTSSDLAYLVRLLDVTRGRAELHVGGPMLALDAMALGATGFLSSEANLAPRLAQAVVAGWDAGDLPATATAYARLMALFAVNMEFTAIAGLKAALGILGLPGGSPRRPRLAADAAGHERMAEALAALDLASLEDWGGTAGLAAAPQAPSPPARRG